MPYTAREPGPKMTVLHLFSGDLWAGAEVMILNLLTELKNDPRMEIFALSLNEGILTERLRKAGIETDVISEADHPLPKIWLKAVRLCRGRRIALIHSHRYKENILALLLAKSIGTKQLVSTLHGLSETPTMAGMQEVSSDLKTKVDYFLLKRFFSRVVAVSEEMKNVLVGKYHFRPERISVIRNGVPIPSLGSSSVPPMGGPIHIGTVGRMVAVKDYTLFLDVAAELRRQTSNVRFSILGEGPLKEQLIQKALDLKINDAVAFLSPRSDPFPFYRSLDIFVNTSFHEGIPLSILEAMACRKPIVAPKVGGIPEIVEQGRSGFLVEERETKAFVQPLLMLIQDRPLRERMGESGLKRVQADFSGSTMAEEYQKIYRQSIRQVGK
jgi:glycosyltransferase involved in cell wall biosynthesis